MTRSSMSTTANNKRLVTVIVTQVKQNKQEIWANAHETRESLWQFRFSSLAENWGVHAKLIYKYQIFYLGRIA